MLGTLPRYFGEEIGFYFGFLGHYVEGLMPIVPMAVVAEAFHILEVTVWKSQSM